MINHIDFVVSESKLKEMAYGDAIYAWLLLHSHYDPEENHNYIYKKDFTYEQIGKDIGRTRQTVSKRFKELLQSNQNPISSKDLIVEMPKYYILPRFKVFQRMDAETVFNLFRICSKSRREEIFKTYAWLLEKWDNREDKSQQTISYRDMIEAFGHSIGNEQTYDKYKDILTTLQGAGLIKFKTTLSRAQNGQYFKSLIISEVNKKASQEWLDKVNK